MTDATELDEAAMRARWTPPKREDFQGPGAEIAHSLALMQWSLSRGTEARTDLPAALNEITRLRAALDEARSTHRDLVCRLGFGDDITEPMADNDTVVAWFEQQSRDANEWQESQLWRNDCYVAGHPDDEDCSEHDPMLRRLAAESALATIRTLARSWSGRHDLLMTGDGAAHDIEAALAAPTTTERSE